MPWKLTRPVPPSCTTFGVFRTNALQLRVATGKLTSKVGSKVCETSVFWVSRMGLSASTSTVEVTELAGSTSSMVRIWPTVRSRFLRSTLPKEAPLDATV